MKRLLPLLLSLVLLCGCTAKEPAAPETPPAEAPAASSAPVSAPDAAAQAAEVYSAILAQGGSTVSVEEPGVGDMTLELTLGISKEFLTEADWSAVDEEDWEALVNTSDRGLLIALSSADGLTAIRCCGDLVMVEAAGESAWFQAEGVYQEFLAMAVDAVDCAVWDVTAEGSLSPQEAAVKMNEAVAENYRNVPDWVEWKPLDVQVGGTGVFDIYWGHPQQFCANFGLRVKVEDVTHGRYGYWQAGAGLGEMDSEGYCGYGAQVQAVKNEAGDWSFRGRGTGGASVILPRKEGENSLELLVEDFFLTEGESHDWHIPDTILECTAEEMARLPEILTRRGEKDAKALCTALGKCLREQDYWAWDLETLGSALGDYGKYL